MGITVCATAQLPAFHIDLTLPLVMKDYNNYEKLQGLTRTGRNLAALNVASLFVDITELLVHIAEPSFRGVVLTVIENSGLPITRAAVTSQNASNKFPCEKPEEWPTCPAHKLTYCNRAGGFSTQNFNICNIAYLLISRDISCLAQNHILFLT